MKKILLILLFFAVLLPLSAQQRTSTLRGVVQDAADNEPLIGALVLVDSTYHAVADTRGRFSVAGIPRGEHTVEISFLGYGKITRIVNFNQAVMELGTVRLNTERQAIDAVIVAGDANMVIQRGDTTQFNAAAFKTNPDADAGDLVSKIPGAEVSDGSVTVQGERVMRVYVDDKLFFGDDVMTAMRNLPADAIESIQMFDEMSDEAKFVGFDDGNRQRALNIVTKHKINRSVAGRLEAGYGLELDKDPNGNYQNRYIVGGNANLFSDKNRWSLNGTANNMNRANRESGFRDGGGGGMHGGGLRTINSVGLNYIGDWTSQLKFTGSYSFNENRSTTDRWTKRDYFSGDRYERDTTYNTSTDREHRGNIRLEYEGKKDRLLFLASGSYEDETKQESFRSHSWLNGADLWGIPTETLNNTLSGAGNEYSFQSNLMWTHKLQKPGRTFSVRLNANLNDSDSDELSHSISSTSEAGQVSILSVSADNGYQLGGRLSYTEPLSAYSRLMATYRLSYNDSESRVEAEDFYTGQLDEARSNTYTRNYLAQTGELGYTYKKDNFNATTSVAYESNDQQRNQEYPVTADPEFERTFTNWRPYVNVRYNLERSKYFDFRYEGRANLPSLQNLQEVVRESGKNLNVGNPNLKESYRHSFNLRYNSSNVEKSTSFWSYIDASLTQDNMSYRTEYIEQDTVLTDYNGYYARAGYRLRTPENMDGAASLRSMLGYSFAFRPLKLNVNISGGYMYGRTPSYTFLQSTRTDLLNYANTHSGNFMLRFVSNISPNVDFNIMSNTSLSYAYNSAEGQGNRRTWNESVTARMNFIFLGGFTYNTDFSWRYQHVMSDNGGTTNSYVWNMGVGYKFLSRKTAEFRITMFDVLNQSQKAPRVSFNTDNESTNWTRSMGRYLLATLSFRFNSMNRMGSGGRPGGMEIDRRGMAPGEGGGMHPMRGGGMGPGPGRP